MLMVDEIKEYDLGKSIIGIKYLSPEEDFFKGHFPGYPIMPGVLTIEALAQTGGILIRLGSDSTSDRIGFLAGVDEAKFMKKIFPGDSIVLKVDVISDDGRVTVVDGKAYVNDELAVKAKITFVISNKTISKKESN